MFFLDTGSFISQQETTNEIFVSGAHVNPAVTIAMGLTKNISFLRTNMFVVAQCGGAIAGAAFLYG
jgi:glycerol uptake facilitator-like aquaporin